MEIEITVARRVIGAAVPAFAVSSWLAHRAEFCDHVRIVVVMEIVWA